MGRRRNPATYSATRYFGLDQDGCELFPPMVDLGPVLSKTITYASRTPEPQTYYVERHTLFGEPTTLYAVKRDEHGGIQTITISQED